MEIKSVKQLIEHIELAQVDEKNFIGKSFSTPWKRVFGGQVLAQSLYAAYQTVAPQRLAHSTHGYFILAGDPNEDIHYEVINLRDGGSFTTRIVIARQFGKAIFNMAASFQLNQEGYDHQITMPNVLTPDSLFPDYKQFEKMKDKWSSNFDSLAVRHTEAIEFRPVENLVHQALQGNQSTRHVWMKIKNDNNDLALPTEHQLMVYASDFNLLITSLLPHAKGAIKEKIHFASLDNAIWFHRPFKTNEWLLFVIESPSASGGRGFTRGSVFSQEGLLVASMSQEGLIRPNKKK